LVEKLIDTTGPIELSEYNTTIDSENFLFQTQKQVELEYDKQENTPKAILGDLAPILLKRLTSAQGDDFLEIVHTLSEGLSSRDIQIYHTYPEIQSAMSKLGWDGSIIGTSGDYLMVSHTNIGGGKTDGIIDDNIQIESTVRKDGRLENLVTITRTHHGLKTSTFSGLNNVSFTRIFVPRGSTLLSVTGASPPSSDLFEQTDGLETDKDLARIEKSYIDKNTGTYIAETQGKTSFGHWIQTKPGTSSTLTFRYLLPVDILEEPKDDFLTKTAEFIGIPQTLNHSITIQSQPGVSYRTTKYKFNANDQLTPLWSTATTATSYTLNNNTDGYFGMVLER